ncbi:MAG: hypothetical protein ABSG68_08660 [Thermoguttaceae bacterium]|jgi:hypothetical protein
MSREEIALASPSALSTAPTEELRSRLSGLLARTADDLREMAGIVAELERRGEDLSGLRLGIVDHLRRIAAGQLLPEIVVRYAGYPQLLRVATSLPLPDQERMLVDPAVQLAVWREGRIEFRQADPLCLSPAQLRQVYAGDRIRSEQEQIGYLESRATPAKAKTVRRGKVWADRQRGALRYGKAVLAVGDVLAALAELRGFDDAGTAEDAELTMQQVRCSQAEARALKMAAAQSGCTVTELVRRALWSAGLFEGRHLPDARSTEH